MKSQKNRPSTIDHRPSTIDNRQSNIPSNIAQSSNRQIAKSSNLQIILFILLSASLFAQNEANIWYFQKNCGLDFNNGEPVLLFDGQIESGMANVTIADLHGDYLFSCEWSRIYSSAGIMENGTGLLSPGLSGRAIVKWPGQEYLYYVFTAVNPNHPDRGLNYCIVDISANNGLGSVIEKNIPITNGWDASDRVAIVKKVNSNNVWLIIRKNVEDSYAVFLIDENGINLNPIISPMPDREPNWESIQGFIKISYNKKFLFANFGNQFEICQFNAKTGLVNYLYLIGPVDPQYQGIRGYEFSPDSKYLYVNYIAASGDSNKIYQFDMSMINDSNSFINSHIYIGIGSANALQLARDGKIYCTPNPYLPETYLYYLSVINKPWIQGAGCDFESNSINLYPNTIGWTLPNMLVDYLLRFEWTGEPCQGYPIHFKPNFIPTPDSIVWNFGEFAPGSISHELSPSYSFQTAGVHEVKVDVWYPGGRFEHTSREIEIQPSPQPNLGPDTLICEGGSFTITANGSGDYFAWSTGQVGTDEITVTDTGNYWVRAGFFSSGCLGYDTIHIGFHPQTIIDETNLQIIPTTCNGASGSITGLHALGSTPYAYQWLDLSGNDYGTDIDATNLPAGQYQLIITDGNGCETVSEVYTIEDAGDLQVTQVQTTRPHCFNDDGQIIVHAYSPSGSILEYSIDAGVNYQYDSVFSGLFALSYAVQVRDENGCSGFYLDNPVHLEDIPGPQVMEVNVTDETDFLGNGAIEIVAGGSTPIIYYSIDSGATYQLNNGTFNNVVCGMYYVIIKDENGCDTTFTVEVQNVILTWLHAVTGEEGICEDSTALIPINVDNFINVADFHLKLGYNADNLECEGFTNIHQQLADSLTGWVDQAAGDIHLAWSGELPLTFSQQAKAADLVFTTKNPGQGELSWYTGETESYFTNASGNPIPAEFSTGEVTVYEPPEIILDQSKTVCTGQFVSLMSIAVGNQPPLSFRWIYPTGDTTSNDPFFFSVTPANAGIYTLLATDRVGCTDQKSIELIVSENPVAAFHGTDTLVVDTGYLLDAGSGQAHYLWNTGDSTSGIVINTEGMYSVAMESTIGCVGSDSVYIKLVEDELPPPDPTFNIFIPNAFSPDGDGVNDVFNVIHISLSFEHFSLSIYDRWGGIVFKSEDESQGWDGKKAGKECPGGVYVYKIVFEVEGVAGRQERVGTVMLVR
jgi:gliding motility-associated-like protein